MPRWKKNPGDKWKPEIDKALAEAKVAILLVSADFLASDFIHNNELPPLLQASEKEGLIILSIIVGHSGAFYKSPIGQYQAMNEPSLPLNTITKGQSEQVFSQLYNRVYGIFVDPPAEKFRRPISTIPKTKEPNDKIYAPQAKENVTKKVGVRKSVATVLQRKTNSSQRNENTALLVKRNGEWAVVTVIKSELSTDLNLIIKSTDLSQKAFLTSLRQSDQLSSIVLGSQTHSCKNAEIQTKTEGMLETWHLKISIHQQNHRAEITFGSLAPNKLAELRARLLLLNEALPNDQSSYRYFGNTIAFDFDVSPLPALFQQLDRQAVAFKRVAPLVATWFLQINNIVEHILKLSFSLKGDLLTVQFEGIRNSQYQNESPATIKFDGKCVLSNPLSDKKLQLGPLSRY